MATSYSDAPIYPDAPSKGRSIYLVCIIAPIITGIFVLLRAYTRFVIKKQNFASDWVAYITYIWVVAFSVLMIPATRHGMGRHTWDFTPEMTKSYYYWIYVSAPFYVLSLLFYKLTLLLLYLQIFGVNRRFRIICYIVMFYTCGYLFCNFVLQLGSCTPREKFWDRKTPGHCTNTVAQNIAFGVGHMTSDIAIAIMPLPMVWRLQLRTKREKWGLIGVLGSGVIAMTVAIVRFIYACVDLTAYDRTGIAGTAFFLSVLEINTGLICGCTPALKPLFVSMRETTQTWTRKYSMPMSRKRSQPGLSGPSSGTGGSGNKGFIELKNYPTGEGDGTGFSQDERRPTYWQQGGKISFAPPAATTTIGTLAEEEEPLPRSQNPRWSHFNMNQSNPKGPKGKVEEEDIVSPLESRGKQDKPGGYKNSWYTNEAV